VCKEMLGKFGLFGVILKSSFVFIKGGIKSRTVCSTYALWQSLHVSL